MIAQNALHKLHKQPSSHKTQRADTDLQKPIVKSDSKAWGFSSIWEAVAIPGPAGSPAKGGDLCS